MTERYTKTIESPEEVKLGKYQILKPLTPEEYGALKERIAVSGIEEMIKVDSDFDVIDGHHRVIAWRSLLREERALPTPVQVLVMADLETEEQKFEKAYELNGPRRHLEKIDKGQICQDTLEKYPQWSNAKVASLAGVNESTVRYHRRVLEHSGRIEPQNSRILADGRVQPIGKKENNGSLSVTTDKPKKTIKEVVTEKLAENPEHTTRTISEQTGAATWLVEAIRGKMVKEGAIPAPPPVSTAAAPPGAIEILAEAGIEVPPPPRGRTHEEKVYEVLAHFRDTMLTMPSDPKAVARCLASQPIQVLATVHDFGELAEWMHQFHAELGTILEEAKERQQVS